MPLRSRDRRHPFCPAAFLFALSLGVTGCATGSRFDVKVDAVSNPAAMSGFSYTIAPRDGGRANNDARYNDVVDRVHVALSQRGMFEAPVPAKADVIVDVDYGEHPPQSKVTTVTQPVMVQPDPLASPYPTPRGTYSGAGVDPITGQPRSQVVMVESTRITYTTEKYIRVSARENGALQGKPAGQGTQVWAVEATVEDEESDFDTALPAMIDAAIEYIGTTTGGQVKVVVNMP